MADKKYLGSRRTRNIAVKLNKIRDAIDEWKGCVSNEKSSEQGAVLELYTRIVAERGFI